MKPKGYIPEETMKLIAALFFLGVLTLFFLAGWGACALVRWLF